MNKTLGIYTFIYNASLYDYPLEESLESAIPIADKIVICECFSKDDTLARLQAFRDKHRDKDIFIFRLPWVRHYSELSAVGNTCLPFLNTDFHWHLQADEVIHENSYDTIKSLINNLPEIYSAISVSYTHMLANYSTEFDFCYKRAIRIARRVSFWRLAGDACQLAGEDVRRVMNSDISVFHYGKVKEGSTGWQKEWDFQNLFKDLGFPDPKMKEMEERYGKQFCDYVYLFQQDIKDGKVRPFTGTHPKFMEQRIKRFKDDGWEQFNSQLIEGLTLK
jgi:hypothetical protein